MSKTSWNLDLLMNDVSEDFLTNHLRKVADETDKFCNKWKPRTDYMEEAESLVKALDEYNNWSTYYGTSGRYYYYLILEQALDQSDPKVKSAINKINQFSNENLNKIQFFELNLAKIPKEKQKEFLAFPGLEKYKHFLEIIFKHADHLLSDKEEKILNEMDKMASTNWVNMVGEFLDKEEGEVLDEDKKLVHKNFNEIFGFLQSQNKDIRNRANEALVTIFSKHLEVAEAELNNICEYKDVIDRLRNYERPDQSRHLSDDIDTQVVDSLVDVVTSNFNLSKDFYKFKAKLLGQESLEYYERMVSYASVEKKYTWEETYNLTHRVFSSLDEEFAQILERFYKNGQIDVYPGKGKSGGAFCIGVGVDVPTYVLLNHNDKLRDVTTLAHEFGHAINNELMKANLNQLNYGAPTSTAEVASTFMEDFVFDELLEKATPEEKLSLMVSKIDDDVSTIFRQIAFYNFETDLHKNFREKGYLPKEEIGELFYKNMEAYLGDVAKGSEPWWIYVGHFRRFFYVYSYASGQLISKALQRKVREDAAFIKEVKKFLSSGSSKSPHELFLDMGIDIKDNQFWQNGVNEVKDLFRETKELAKELNKI